MDGSHRPCRLLKGAGTAEQALTIGHHDAHVLALGAEGAGFDLHAHLADMASW